MTTKAYFLIRTTAEAAHDGYAECIRDLEAMPEVECVEPVTGQYDLLATVEAHTTRLSSLVDKVMAKSWAERVQVHTVNRPVEPPLDWEEARAARLRRDREIVKAFRRSLQRQSVSSQQPYAARAAAIRAELEEARSLSRQVEIIRAYCQKRHTRGEPGPSESP